MSTAASLEVAWTNQNLAEQIDWRLTDIAHEMPIDAFLGDAGTPVVFHRQEGVGELSCTNVGKYMVVVTARLEGYDGQLGFWKEYALTDGRKENRLRLFQTHEVAKTAPDELEDCPNKEALADGLRDLYEGFIGSVVVEHDESANVIDMTERLTA